MLASQLTNELRALFPNNAVEFFVSYYDYYLPEAFNSASDTYIDKVPAVQVVDTCCGNTRIDNICGFFEIHLRYAEYLRRPRHAIANYVPVVFCVTAVCVELHLTIGDEP